MTRARLATVLVAAAALVWLVAGRPGVNGGTHTDPPAAPTSRPGARSLDPALGQQLGQLGRNRSGAIDLHRSAPGIDVPADGSVTITGKVLDQEAHAGVGNVEVVFRSPLGESSATSAADGTYKIAVAPGTYRAFVRDDNALSVGVQDMVRVPGMPSSEAANAPDEGLMPTVVAVTDVDHVDLSVVFGGVVSGRVVDRSGHPVVGAVLRARGGELRPALGTDVAESDEKGTFEMRLPPGQYVVEATHAQLAGVTGDATMMVERGQTARPTVTLTAGCVIAGRVVGANGQPAGEGAMERRYGPGENEFTPTGRIEADGTFRWTTSEPAAITLRAWPWKSPPAPAQTFACRDGARFTNVVFLIPNQPPDIAGTLVDAAGAPVAFGYIDVNPLAGGFGQQERTDAEGRWAVYHMPAGRYRITATSASRGVVVDEVDAPRTNVALVLGGTGRIEGSTPQLAEGSFEISLLACDGLVALPRAPHLVAVHDHHYALDDVPACSLTGVATWQGEEIPIEELKVLPGGVTTHDVMVGPAHELTIHGLVRDEAGHPVAGASVYVIGRSQRQREEAHTDASGHYTMTGESGAEVMATDPTGRQGFAQVSEEMHDDETVDIPLVVLNEGEGEGESMPIPPTERDR